MLPRGRSRLVVPQTQAQHRREAVQDGHGHEHQQQRTEAAQAELWLLGQEHTTQARTADSHKPSITRPTSVTQAIHVGFERDRVEVRERLLECSGAYARSRLTSSGTAR
jgi:hypothetical protein